MSLAAKAQEQAEPLAGSWRSASRRKACGAANSPCMQVPRYFQCTSGVCTSAEHSWLSVTPIIIDEQPFERIVEAVKDLIEQEVESAEYVAMLQGIGATAGLQPNLGGWKAPDLSGT